MRNQFLALCGAGAVLTALLAQTPAADPKPILPKTTPAQVERGKYLAESVSTCQECHTPRTADGKLDREKWMQGAELGFVPRGEAPKDWHERAPGITPSGRLWARWTPDGISKFMQTGVTPRGGHAGPPMPEYRYSKEDAEAIVAYLSTLK